MHTLTTSPATTDSTRHLPCPDRPDRQDRQARRAASAAEAEYDAELVRRFNQGDESAFLEIMERYREKIFMIARALLRNHADAEEITQDTFVRAHRGLVNFRGDSSLATWLHRVALNLARNRYWYFFRRRRFDTLSLDHPLSDDSSATFTDLVATDAPDPARAAASDEFSQLIYVCMEKLPSGQREILMLRNTLDQSYAEIAATLGITVGTVKSRIARARENVRKLMAATCPECGTEEPLSDWFETPRKTGILTRAVA
jgi:RNA polymerase sigma-70 factor, ECF subfamily